jgi:hypothetical protein
MLGRPKFFTEGECRKMKTKPQERFYQRLLRWIHRCPQCNENSLLLGVQAGTSHICRSCLHRFIIGDETQVWKASEAEGRANNGETDTLLAA